MSFLDRVRDLPTLGVGVSTEYGASSAEGTLDVMALRRGWPQHARFLEVGVEVAKGLDADARRWVGRGLPTTYHFLDVNLDEPEDLDPRWLSEVRALSEIMDPAWICGDAGLWHFGPRGRGHMLLLPPVLTAEGARRLAEGVAALRGATGMEVLPENPPGAAFVGDLHLLEFLARVAEEGDTGLLLDVAHLAIYQRVTGRLPGDGLDTLPWDRVVELHVAGGVERDHRGFAWVEDSHSAEVLPEVWWLFEQAVDRASNLKAVVFECERNPLEACLPGFERLQRGLVGTPLEAR